MQSLGLGVLAALMWGLHDFIVRRIGGRAAVASMLLLVALVGCLILLPLALLSDGPPIDRASLGLAVASGVGLTSASVGLYRAFAIGPVRLVAPICGAYPVLSVIIALAGGQSTGALVWLGVLAVVGGIALVARGEAGTSQGSPRIAMAWAALAAVSFAATFGLAQAAAAAGAVLPVALIGRVTLLGLVLVWTGLRRPAIAPALALWRPLLAMAVLDTGALTALTLAGRLARPEFASVASSAFGLVTILLAWRLLGEPMRAPQWVGVAAVFGGLALLGAA